MIKNKKADVYASIKPVSRAVLKSGDNMAVEVSYRLKPKKSDLETVFPSVALYINNTPIVFDTIRDKEWETNRY